MSPGAQSRVGWGFDAHRLDGDPPLLLAGVIVSGSVGVRATSDGDLVAHAVTDGLLGACVLGDIGEHFPSDEPAQRGADSMTMLRRCVALAFDAGWVVDHVDVTVIAQEVRIAPHRAEMARRLAETLGVGSEAVSIKGTTTDGMGFTGRGEGLAAVAVVSVKPTLST